MSTIQPIRTRERTVTHEPGATPMRLSDRSLLVRLLPAVVLLFTGGCRADADLPDPDARAEPGIPAVSFPTLEVTDTELRVRTDAGETRHVSLVDSADGTRFVAAALRPGSTEESATIVAIVGTGDGYALHWLAMGGGEPERLRAFPPRFRGMIGLPTREGTEPSITWTPDAGSIALMGWTEEGVASLQTVGWDDGPGTGEPATDNASFVLEPVPAGSRIAAWREIAPSTWQAELEGIDGERWILLVERQADGAVALPPAPGGNPCRDPCDPR